MPETNMFGLVPCPKCQSKYRWPTQACHPTDPNMILCDDCGYKEPKPKEDEDDDS